MGNGKIDSSALKPLRKPLNRACDKPRRHAARPLGETEDTVADGATSMFPKDGAIQIINDNSGAGDWAIASAFTNEGLESLRYIIDETKLHGSQHHVRQP